MIPVIVRNVREIPIGLIDDPEIAMRDTLDDQAFVELKQSIAAHGVQIPLLITPRGERFRLVAGHRRITAARALDAVTVPCDVRELDDADIEFLKILENEDREEVNAADAALYFQRLYVEKCAEDLDRLCAFVKRKRAYVEERLLLVYGCPEVFDVLKRRKITFGVAKELNQIKDLGYRRLHLDNAEKYGMTVAAAKDARKQANFALEHGTRPANDNVSSAEIAVAAHPAMYACYICGRTNHPERLRGVMVHEHCDLAIGQRVLASFKEPDDVEPTPQPTGDRS